MNIHRYFFAGLLISSTAAAQQKAPIDLTGRWKEARRLDAKNETVTFTDTLYLDFLIGNEYLWKKAGSYMYKGTYKATKDQLDLGARIFTILRTNARQLVLKDENNTYELINYTKPEVKENNTLAASTTRGNTAAASAINKEELSGKWETYKRTSSIQLKEINYRRMIKQLDLRWDGHALSGTVIPAQNDQQAANWTIDAYKNGTIYCSGPDKRTLQLLKCAGGELILQEELITYFFKKFK